MVTFEFYKNGVREPVARNGSGRFNEVMAYARIWAETGYLDYMSIMTRADTVPRRISASALLELSEW